MLHFIHHNLEGIIENTNQDRYPFFCLKEGEEKKVWDKLYPYTLELENSSEYPCFIADSASSSLDIAHKLVEQGCFPEFASALCLSQSQGRGQLRRPWASKEGNLYAALRLPENYPFNEEVAAPALGALLVEALNSFGYSCQLKWPNDIIQYQNGTWVKVGGILLEERNDALIAGIGLNLTHAPDASQLRKDYLFPAGILEKQKNTKNILNSEKYFTDIIHKKVCSPCENQEEFFDFTQNNTQEPFSFPKIWGLWLALVERLFLWYRGVCFNTKHKYDWHITAKKYLAFVDETLCIQHALTAENEPYEIIKGRLQGIHLNGSLLIETEAGIKNIIGGSITLINEGKRW